MRILTSVKMRFIHDIGAKAPLLCAVLTCDLNILLFMSCQFYHVSM